MDDWALPMILIQISGGTPRPVSVDQLVRCDRVVVASFRGPYVAVSGCAGFSACRTSSGADRSLKNSVGAIGWPRDGRPFTGEDLRSRPGWSTSVPAPARKYNCFCPRTGSGLPADQACPLGDGYHNGSYLVDSASSHMLVSKIKPCMSKYKQSYCETANGSLNQLSFI